jgi:hypothetical protein
VCYYECASGDCPGGPLSDQEVCDLQCIRAYDPLAYRQGRWHIRGEGDRATLCGQAITTRRTQEREGLADYEVCRRCRAKAAGPAATPKMGVHAMKALLARAAEAAIAAHYAAQPTPMLVGEPVNLMASLTGGDDGGFRKDRPIDYVAEGVCGFAYVYVRPANSRLANYLRKQGMGRTDDYHGGLLVRLWQVCGNDDLRYCQSYARNCASAQAFAAVLREAGIDATVQTRVD